MNSWVYSRNKDFAVFGGSMLFAILLGLIFPQGDFYQTMFVYVFIDISHSFTTYFYTLNSDRINHTHHKYFFWGILALVYSICCLMILGGMILPLLKLYTIASLYHFMKQSQAWVFISSKKSKPKNKFEDKVNFMTSYAAVWCPQIISMTLPEPTPWFIPGDIPGLPSYFREISLLVGLVILSLYLFIEIRRWINERVILWGKHFHVLFACMVWCTARLSILASISYSIAPLMMMACHSFPYYYLGNHYISNRTKSNERFWPYFKSPKILFMMIWIMCIILTSAQFLTVRYVWDRSFLVQGAMIAIAVTHYIYDSYLWKRDTHPEGAAVFVS